MLFGNRLKPGGSYKLITALLLVAVIIPFSCSRKKDKKWFFFPPQTGWTGTWTGSITNGFFKSSMELVFKNSSSAGFTGEWVIDGDESLTLLDLQLAEPDISFHVIYGNITIDMTGTRVVVDLIEGDFILSEGNKSDTTGKWRVVRKGRPPYGPFPETNPPIPAPATIKPLTPYEQAVFIPFYNMSETDFTITDTYYIATNEPGASNTNNGLYPTHQGGQDGPFKDFNDWNVRDKLYSATDGVKVVVCEGTYILEDLGEGRIVINGSGDEFHPTILTGYPGETAVLESDGRITHGRRGEIAQVHGRHCIVENLVFRNKMEAKYNIIVTGNNAIIRNCVFLGPQHEDSLKVGSECDHCFIYNNDISAYGSQAVDNFGLNVLVKQNVMHHDTSGVGVGIGTKGGTLNMVVADNLFHNLSRAGITFGGTGSLIWYRKDPSGDYYHAARYPVAVNNTFCNIGGLAVNFTSCLDGVFENNTIYDMGAGYAVGIEPDAFNGPDADRILPLPRTEGTVIRNNRLANIWSEQMALVEDGDATGLLMENNTYYSDNEPVFYYRNQDASMQEYTLSGFQAAYGYESGSTIRPISDFSP